MKAFKEFIEPTQPDTVSIIAVGDIFPGRNVEHKALGLGYGYPFANIGNHLACDLLIGNLEGVVDDIYGTQIRLKTTPRLSMSKDWIPELKKVGFNVLNVANNHFCDYGKEGAVNTIHVLADNGIPTVGCWGDFWIEERNGISVGFIGCIDDKLFGAEKAVGLQGLDDVEDAIKAAKHWVDVLIVQVHTGKEYATTETQEQVDLARRLVNAGANAVIMHHPHVIQPCEIYKGAFIAYSLGNWIFDQDQEGTQTGLSVKVRFNKSGDLLKIATSKHTIDNYVINYQPWEEF